ncbi:P-loop NTPase fold protein [Streptomyces sp. NPDC047043]|uniref:KAP family P-loop NTPase fold protein n=1 Tax=Streptomyces sp. NPDC047043 TaxID=3154497 RepID=UPI0033DC0A0A
MTGNESINAGSLLSGDDPIDDASQDLLQRADLADAFAAEIRRTSAKHGAVVALTGKWGSGKTSLANLTRRALDAVDEVYVVQFNPWFFSGTDQLMRFFFDELAGQLRDGRRLKDKLKGAGRTVAERLGRYAAALSPLKFVPGASVVLDGASAVAAGTSMLLGEEQGTIHEQRAQLTELLGKLPGRIVVFIDDIDRLAQQEIRDVFRLARLTGSFPNIVYVLCFDREVVEAALTDESVKGSAYLEKIVKMSVEVPPLPALALFPVIATGLAQALDGIECGPFHAARWPDVLAQLILPMFSTVRDVKRYLASVPLAVRSLGTEVNLVDILALEALRVRFLAAHAMLPAAADLLAPAKTMYRPSMDRAPREKAFVEEFTGLLNDHAQPVVRLLFPAAERLFGGQNYGSDWIPAWERDRRVACSTVLDFYLHRRLPAGRAPAECVEQVAACIGNESALDEVLGQVPDALLDDTLKRLVPHCRDAPEETVLPTAAALMRQLPRVRLGSTGMYSLGGEWAVLSPVSVLLHNLVGDVADHTVRSLFSGIPSLYGKVLLLDIAAGRADKQGLIPEESAQLLRQELASQLRTAGPADLAGERMLLRTVLVATADTDGPPVLEPVFDARVVARLLESAVTPVHSQTMGSVAVHTEKRLVWASLVNVYGGEAHLAEAVASLHQSLQEGTVELNEDLATALALYEKYATGWRPDEL